LRAKRQSKQQRLSIEIEHGAIVIRLPLSVIPHALPYAIEREFGIESKIQLANAKTFGKEVVDALHREAEDGATLVTELFDKAFIRAIDDGAQGIDYK
jgi:hypothetical protein